MATGAASYTCYEAVFGARHFEPPGERASGCRRRFRHVSGAQDAQRIRKNDSRVLCGHATPKGSLMRGAPRKCDQSSSDVCRGKSSGSGPSPFGHQMSPFTYNWNILIGWKTDYKCHQNGIFSRVFTHQPTTSYIAVYSNVCLSGGSVARGQV